MTELIACLSNVTKQRFDSFEIIVVDGSDSLKESNLIEMFKDVKFIIESDKNVYDAMNKGITKATGEWLYFMGVDDRFYDFNVLRSVVPFFNENKVKLILGQISYKYERNDSYFIKRNDGLVKPVWSAKIWLKNTLQHQGVFYHKSNFYEQNYDIRYSILADYAFNLSLWKKRVPVLILDKVIAKCGTGGLSKNYSFKLYREEVDLKTRASSIVLKPIFFILAMVKMSLKRI